MNDKITVCLGKGGQREMAESFARKNNVPIMDKPGEHLTVMFDSRGVSLTGYGLTYQGDFEGMLHRVTNGRLSHEMLVRAVKTEGEHLKAIDATAGMGEDGFLLAAYGYEVTLYEQNPVIAALLKDALRRARKHPVLKDIASRMKLVEGDSVSCMEKLMDPVDVIYLDPMFPKRQKSGLINKKLQLIQKLVTVSEMAEAKNVTLQNACYVDFWPSTLSNGDVPGYQGGSDAAASADGTDGTSDASADSSDGSTDSSDGSGDYSDGSSDDGSYDDGSSDDGSYDDGSSDDSEDYSDDSVDYGDGTE